MIRYINCLRKHADISDADFREYWEGAEFNDLIEKVAALTQARHYSKNLTLRVNMADNLIKERGLAQPYDGTVEYYWDNASHLEGIYASAEAHQLIGQMQRYQSQFIDLANSTAFFTELKD